jgi:hypothetical protein
LSSTKKTAEYPHNVRELYRINDVHSAVRSDGDFIAHGRRPKDVEQSMTYLGERMEGANVSQAVIDEMTRESMQQKVTRGKMLTQPRMGTIVDH